jgi:hypothetical protein
MNIAAHHSMIGGSGKWRNPYVTNGLICMYDGIWNVGPELHDANTLTWKNLGSLGSAYDATRTQGAFVADGASIVRSWQNPYVFKIPGYLMRYHMQGEWTYEIGFTPASGWAVNYAGLWGNHGSGKGVAGGQYENGSVSFGLYDPSVSLYTVPSSTFSNGRKYAVTQVASDTSKTSTTYKDGVVVASSTDVDVLLTYRNALTYIGAAHGDVGRSYNGTIHFLRVYNRPLTSAEVARNRIIDINRFNLPT